MTSLRIQTGPRTEARPAEAPKVEDAATKRAAHAPGTTCAGPTPTAPTGPRPGFRGIGPGQPLGQMLSAVLRSARPVAASAALAGALIGLTGCGVELPSSPRPHEPISDIRLGLGAGGLEFETRGETRVAAELRARLHRHANERHWGSRAWMFQHHAGEDQRLSVSEVASMYKAAGVGDGDLERTVAAKLTMGIRDGSGDRRLDWDEFKPMIFAPSELEDGR